MSHHSNRLEAARKDMWPRPFAIKKCPGPVIGQNELLRKFAKTDKVTGTVSQLICNPHVGDKACIEWRFVDNELYRTNNSFRVDALVFQVAPTTLLATMWQDTSNAVPAGPIPTGTDSPDSLRTGAVTGIPPMVTPEGEGNQSSLHAVWRQHLAAAQSGQSEAVGKLIDQIRDYLLLVAGRELDDSLRSKVSASDLVQLTMLEATRDFKKFRGESSGELNGWLIRILRHNLSDVARRYRGTQCRDLSREMVGLADQGGPLISNQGTPSSICRRVEADQQLDRAVMRLPEHYQRVVHLRHIEDLSWNEVAAQLNISADAARKLWARTLDKLRQELSGDS